MSITTPNAEDNTIPLSVVFAAIWRRKWFVLGITMLGAVVGVGLYFIVPRTFSVQVDVSPLRQGDFSAYLSLVDAKAFPYTPETLAEEYVNYLNDADNLAALAESTGVVPRSGMTDEQYAQAIAEFISGMSLQLVSVGSDTQKNVRVILRGGDPTTLTEFVRQAITSASRDFSAHMAGEVRDRADALRDSQTSAAQVLSVKIDAAQQQAEEERHDLVARLTEDSNVARSLGIEKPIVVQSLAPTNINPESLVSVGSPENYLQGFQALDQRIGLLQSRTDNQPFVEDLRPLESDLYVAQHDPQADRLLTLLSKTPLAKPEMVNLVRYSTKALQASQVFPRLSVFAGLGLLLGLILGIAAAVAWDFSRAVGRPT